MPKLTPLALFKLIQSTKGRIFSVVFVKRSTKEVREMTCRIGVNAHQKGGLKGYDADAKLLVTVYDVEKARELPEAQRHLAYRSIPLEGIISITIDNVRYVKE